MPGLASKGCGLGVSGPALATAIANTVHEDDLGVAGATQQMMTQFGVVIGIQLMQTVQAARAPVVGVTEAFSTAYLVGAGSAFVGILLAFTIRPTARSAKIGRGGSAAEE